MNQLLLICHRQKEAITEFLERLKEKATVCDLMISCNGKGLADQEIREEVLAKTVEMNLDETIKFVESRKTGHRSTTHLSTGNLPCLDVSKITTCKKDKKQELIPSTVNSPTGRVDFKNYNCSSCEKTGHGCYSSHESLSFK